MIDPRSHAVDPAWVDTRNAAVSADPAARVAGNAVATTDVEKLTVDRRVIASIDTSVSDLIPDAIVTDQKRSGRCWAFAGLNVLRASLIEELTVDSLELSQNFIYFHDKLEKAAAFLHRAVDDAERPLSDREVVETLREPISDGGWWPEFARLVSKYGMVPHAAMPDTHSATDSDAMNAHLATVLRRAALRLRAAVAAGEGAPKAVLRPVTVPADMVAGAPVEALPAAFGQRAGNRGGRRRCRRQKGQCHPGHECERTITPLSPHIYDVSPFRSTRASTAPRARLACAPPTRRQGSRLRGVQSATGVHAIGARVPARADRGRRRFPVDSIDGIVRRNECAPLKESPCPGIISSDTWNCWRFPYSSSC